MGRIATNLLDTSRGAIDLLNALNELPRDQLPEVRARLRLLTRHPDRDVRVLAMRRLFVHLKDREFRSDALGILKNDNDERVRRVAAFAISSTSDEKTRSGDVATLLSCLRDENEVVSVRGAAYEALLLIHHRTDFPPIKSDIDLSNDVNWDWIESLMKG